MVLGKQLGGLFLAGTASVLIGCGADRSPAAAPAVTHMASPPPVTVAFDPSVYVLALEEHLTVTAHVTGTEKTVTWTLDCDSGRASIVPNGNSVKVTALAGGTCFLWASEGQVGAVAIVRIPPLATGDSCTDDAQCSQDAPKCALAVPPCGKTCTLACAGDGDCPIRDAYGNHVSCTNHLCQLVRDPDYACP